MLHFDNNLKDEISPQYRSLASNARMGLKQALMSTDLSESIQDSQVMGIHPTSESELQSDGVLVDFFVHLTKQQDEDELKNKLIKSLERNNYILGESDITAARFTDSLQAQGKITKINWSLKHGWHLLNTKFQILMSAVMKAITIVPNSLIVSTKRELTVANVDRVSSIPKKMVVLVLVKH